MSKYLGKQPDQNPLSLQIQVISPFTGRVLASTSIEVTSSDRVDLIGTRVSVLTGLHLVAQLQQHHHHQQQHQQQLHQQQQQHQHDHPTSVVASLSRFHRFHAMGQKGNLDIELLFSDGTVFPLDAIPPNEYTILVNSLATDVVALATPSSSSSSPSSMTSSKFSSSKNKSHVATLVATGEGSGDFLYVSIDSPGEALVVWR